MQSQLYKESLTKKKNSVQLAKYSDKIDYDPNEVDSFFHQCFFALFQMDQNRKFNEEIPVYTELCNILSKYDNLDFTGIHQLNIFNIFLNFIQFSGAEHYNESTDLIVRVIILMFRQSRTLFAEEFTSSFLCKIFTQNLNLQILRLFAILIGESEKINRDLTNYQLIDKLNELNSIPNVNELEFKRAKFLIYANFILKCDMTDFMNCKTPIYLCSNEIQNEEDDECYNYRMLCISRAIERSEPIMQFLVASNLIVYINNILMTGNKIRINQCLLVLEILTSSANQISDHISSQLSLLELIKQLVDLDDNGLKAMNCIINLISYNVFPIGMYVQNKFPEMINNIFVNGNFHIKKLAICCINNMMYYNYPISSAFSNEIINNIILSILDFSFDDNEEFVNYCLIIIKRFIDEDKLFHIDEIGYFLEDLREKSKNQICLKCSDILRVINEKINQSNNE